MRKLILSLVLLLPLTLHAQWGQPNATMTKYQSKDTTKTRWNLDDSSIVKTSRSGQLIEHILRNNDYDASDGIHMETKTPDGDSVSSGMWFSGSRKISFFSNHDTKLTIEPTGIYAPSNLTINPSAGGTYPFLILQNSSGNSSFLSLSSTSKLIQFGTGFNIPNLSPSTPQEGDVWRSGNIVKYRLNGQTVGFDFTITPTLGMGWRYNGTNYAPGYPDTNTSGGGGGGSSRWDSLTAPGANLALSMTTYTTDFGWGDFSGTPLTIKDAAGSTSDYLMKVFVDPTGSTRKPLAVLGNNGYGVEVTNAGVLQPVSSGHISADKWKGLDTVARANLPAKTAFEDKSNNFTAPQVTLIDANDVALGGSNNYSGFGVGVQGNVAGSSGAGVYGYSGGAAHGLWGRSTSGVGLYANTSATEIAHFAKSDVVKLVVAETNIFPASTGYDLGSSTKRMDSLFVVAIEGKNYGTAVLQPGDSVNVYVKGATSSWIVQAFFRGGQGSEGGLNAYCTTDTAHISAELLQSAGSLVITYSAERIVP